MRFLGIVLQICLAPLAFGQDAGFPEAAPRKDGAKQTLAKPEAPSTMQQDAGSGSGAKISPEPERLRKR